MADRDDPLQPISQPTETRHQRGATGPILTAQMPADQNPWYILMTIAGEQSAQHILETDPQLAAKNRRFWNAWACSNKTDEQRKDLAKTLGLAAQDLRPWTSTEKAIVLARFHKALPGQSIPDASKSVDLSDTHFPCALVLEKYVFSTDVSLDASTFQGDAYFSSSTFQGDAYFNASTFLSDAYFGSSTFTCGAYFSSATFDAATYFTSAAFLAEASFRSATFVGAVSFRSTSFAADAYFSASAFTGDANFGASTFARNVDFLNGAFSSTTDFTQTKFTGHVPIFQHCDLHSDSTFSTDQKLWPQMTDDLDRLKVETDKSAYIHLANAMRALGKPDVERFFRRQEMRGAAMLEGGLSRALHHANAAISDLGYAMWRPLQRLVGTVPEEVRNRFRTK